MTQARARRVILDFGPEEAGARLDKALSAAMPELSRSRLKSLIQAGHLAMGGQTITDPAYRVKPGQRASLLVPPAAEAVPQGQDIPLAVVYEDDALIVIDKPAGLVVHPAPGNPDRTLVNALIAHCGASLSGIGGVRRPGIVHRLDKETSGLMLAAKTDAAHAALAQQFAAHTIGRAYHALVWGVPTPAAGLIEGAIGRARANRKKMALVTRGGKAARTRYRVLERFCGDALAIVECRLETGRTHQIRVHMSSRGHAVVGDPLYGAGRPQRRPSSMPELAPLAALRRQALHAVELGFHHPESGRLLSFTSPLPPDMAELVERLRALPQPRR